MNCIVINVVYTTSMNDIVINVYSSKVVLYAVRVAVSLSKDSKMCLVCRVVI